MKWLIAEIEANLIQNDERSIVVYVSTTPSLTHGSHFDRYCLKEETGKYK